MNDYRKPYIVIPRLISQPTWGGSYIVSMKSWNTRKELDSAVIGQSYELYSGSKFAGTIKDTSEKMFLPESDGIQTPEHNGTPNAAGVIELAGLMADDADQLIGPAVNSKFRCMPLLLKLTQARGNSFQLHVKPGDNHGKWSAKPESWYFFENGDITIGIRPGCDVTEFKKICLKADESMHDLSRRVKSGELALSAARTRAREIVLKLNPWQFVNTLSVPAGSVVDPSAGGIHHSWEENGQPGSVGNIVYEIQQDVMDPISTIRCFDQGKFTDDGSVRQLQIEDYFRHLDIDLKHNDISRLVYIPKSRILVANDLYRMEELTITSTETVETGQSFHHLFLRSGSARVQTDAGSVRFSAGHSVFVPFGALKYEIIPESPTRVIISSVTTDG